MGNTNEKKATGGETNVPEEALEDIEQIRISIEFREGERFTTVEFAQKSGIDVLLKDDDSKRKQRIMNDLIKMLEIQGSVKAVGISSTHRKGRQLMVYQVLKPLKWTLSVGED